MTRIDDLDDERLASDTDSVLEGAFVDEDPLFSIGEMTKVFFAEKSHWLRYYERRNVKKGVGGRRSDHDARRYSLRDVELVAKALYRAEALTRSQLVATLQTVRSVAEVWTFFTCGWCDHAVEFDTRDTWERDRDGTVWHLDCLVEKERAEEAAAEAEAEVA
jgi:hypothetical protein